MVDETAMIGTQGVSGSDLPGASPHRRPFSKHLLFIAHAFPPVHRSSTFRTLAFVRHLARNGWTVTVVTSDQTCEPVDENLMRDVPDSTRVIRVARRDPIARLKSACDKLWGITTGREEPITPNDARATPERRKIRAFGLRELLSQALSTPDTQVGWIGPATNAAMREFQQRPFDLIYSTAPPCSAHLVAQRVARASGRPWIADFRDPWVDNPYRELRYAVLRWVDRRLENRVMARASHVVCASPTMTARLAQRYPRYAHRITTILNGFDRDRVVDVVPHRVGSTDDLVLVHCGQFYGHRTPHVWIRALKRLRSTTVGNSRRIWFVHVGPERFDGASIQELARDAGVEGMVRMIGNVPHREALSIVAGADALVLNGFDGSGADLQIPNKLFEYLYFGKPIIAAVPSNSPVRSILEDADAGSFVCGPEDDHGVASAIERLWNGHPLTAGAHWSSVERFDRRYRCEELARIVNVLAGNQSVIRTAATVVSSQTVQDEGVTGSLATDGGLGSVSG